MDAQSVVEEEGGPTQITDGPTSGVILEDRNGNIYLIRLEVLALSQVPPGLAEDARERIKAGVKSIGAEDILASANETGFYVVGGVNIEHLEALTAVPA